jgi:hypothetical protein
MSIILGIDPGHIQTAWIRWHIPDNEPMDFGITENEKFLSEDLPIIQDRTVKDITICAIEMIQSFGMPVGKEIFETVFFIGRLWECITTEKYLAYRKNIKLHFCETLRAKDGNIRQALIDRFGTPGTKKNPGKLYGVSKDIWSALAVAIYWHDNFWKPKVKQIDVEPRTEISIQRMGQEE